MNILILNKMEFLSMLLKTIGNIIIVTTAYIMILDEIFVNTADFLEQTRDLYSTVTSKRHSTNFALATPNIKNEIQN